jgi:hypothetical protein
MQNLAYRWHDPATVMPAVKSQTEHGSTKGFYQHRSHRTDPCLSCRLAVNEYNRKWRETHGRTAGGRIRREEEYNV